ncbi:MAG: hypothetical protein QE273_05755 [Verrucomicrobiales bacterium]|jgi:hypothetical protein|nr:hypothetical protein [Verrucomicrobiales bacterium]
MKIVFDENVPWPLRKFIPAHEVTSVQREGFGGMENGALLARLDGSFDVFILCDKNLRYQQNLSGRLIAIIELPTNRWPILMKLEQEILRAVEDSFTGSYQAVEEPISGDEAVDPAP